MNDQPHVTLSLSRTNLDLLLSSSSSSFQMKNVLERPISDSSYILQTMTNWWRHQKDKIELQGKRIRRHWESNIHLLFEYSSSRIIHLFWTVCYTGTNARMGWARSLASFSSKWAWPKWLTIFLVNWNGAHSIDEWSRFGSATPLDSRLNGWHFQQINGYHLISYISVFVFWTLRQSTNLRNPGTCEIKIWRYNRSVNLYFHSYTG